MAKWLEDIEAKVCATIPDLSTVNRTPFSHPSRALDIAFEIQGAVRRMVFMSPVRDDLLDVVAVVKDMIEAGTSRVKHCYVRLKSDPMIESVEIVITPYVVVSGERRTEFEIVVATFRGGKDPVGRAAKYARRLELAIAGRGSR